jgi:hypothetical protein
VLSKGFLDKYGEVGLRPLNLDHTPFTVSAGASSLAVFDQDYDEDYD